MIALLLIPITIAVSFVVVLGHQEQRPQVELIEIVEYPQRGVTCYLYKHSYISCVKTEAPK